jgi:hypothetical protein
MNIDDEYDYSDDEQGGGEDVSLSFPDIDKSKFRVPGNNNWFTQGLFLEESNYDKLGSAVFTLGDVDKEYKGKTYYSLKRLYLERDDLEGYLMSVDILGGWSHWMRMRKHKKLKDHFDEWEDELSVKLRVLGVKTMIAEVRHGGRQAASCSRWLADSGFVPKENRPKKAVGRPTKDTQLADAARDSQVATQVEQDFLDLAKKMN